MEISIKWNLCRICLKEKNNIKNENLLSIYSETSFDFEVTKAVQEICGVEMKSTDGLPDKICQSCVTSLQQAINFRTNCRKSDDYLKTVLSQAKSVTNFLKIDNPESIKSGVKSDEAEPLDCNGDGADDLQPHDCDGDGDDDIQPHDLDDDGDDDMQPHDSDGNGDGGDDNDIQGTIEIFKESTNTNPEIEAELSEEVFDANIKDNEKSSKQRQQIILNSREKIHCTKGTSPSRDDFDYFAQKEKEFDISNIKVLDNDSQMSTQFESENDSSCNRPTKVQKLLNNVLREAIETTETEIEIEDEVKQKTIDNWKITRKISNVTMAKQKKNYSKVKENGMNIGDQDIEDGLSSEFIYFINDNNAHKKDFELNVKDGITDDESQLLIHDDGNRSRDDGANIGTVEDIDTEKNLTVSKDEPLLIEYQIVDNPLQEGPSNSNTSEDFCPMEEETIAINEIAASTKNSNNFNVENKLEKRPNLHKQNTISTSYVIMNGIKTFYCNICGNNFPNRGLLSHHVRIHQKEKRFECELCFKRFATSCNLDSHIRIHTGEKKYECEYCKRRFGNRSTHIKHLRTHTNEKPFICGYCQKAFSLSTSLRAHERIHTGEKPYRCIPCSKDFKLQHQLKAHLNTSCHKSVAALFVPELSNEKNKNKYDYNILL